MKHFIILLTLLFTHAIVFAQSREVRMLPWDDENSLGGTRTSTTIPSVEYDNESINIFYSSSIDFLQVVIRDEDGNIIYNNVVAFVPPSLTLALSDAVDENKYSIELIYGGIHLIGYF